MHRIFEVIEAYHMIEPGMHVIAGVSGGADSVCLLYVLCEYRKRTSFELTAVHVEHGLRGEESLEDARFTQQFCRHLGVPFRLVHADVKGIVKEQGLSTEEAGRMERYRIFREVKRECGAQKIAVAHNENDQAETVLHHLVRGSGLKGLGGICPVRDDIIRPLLFTQRKEIEEILTQAGLSWRVDRTNRELEYTRNKIRLSILPQMERELNDQAVEHISQAAGRLRQVQSYLERVAGQAAQRCISGVPASDGPHRQEIGEWKESQTDACSVCILLPPFLEEDELIQQELMRKALSMCGGLRDVGAVHIESLMKLARMGCGREISLPGGIRAVREERKIRFAPGGHRGNDDARKDGDMRSGGKGGDMRGSREDKDMRGSRKGGDMRSGHGIESTVMREIVIDGPGRYQTPEWDISVELLDNSETLYAQIIKEKKYTKWLSYDTINDDILFRTRRTGDYLVINEQGGRKKLKDYLIDCKIPRDKRNQMWLLAEESHILWVMGYRISEAAKVTRATKKVIKIQLEERSK